MITMTDRRALTANQFTANVLVDKQFSRAPFRARARFYFTASGNFPQVHVAIGGSTLVDGEEVSSLNRLPQIPDDFFAEGVVMPGQLISIRFREVGGVTPTVFSRVDLVPF